MTALRTFWRAVPGTRSLELHSAPGCFGARPVVAEVWFRDDASYERAAEVLTVRRVSGEAPDA